VSSSSSSPAVSYLRKELLPYIPRGIHVSYSIICFSFSHISRKR
jgi:hypothetical protein